MNTGTPLLTRVPSRDTAWQDRALCAGAAPDMWDLFGNGLTEDNLTARAICQRCPVQAACAEQAEADGDWGVIRGGEPRFKYRRPAAACFICDGELSLDRNANQRLCDNPACRTAADRLRKKRHYASTTGESRREERARIIRQRAGS
jgi:hypothetical protein